MIHYILPTNEKNLPGQIQILNLLSFVKKKTGNQTERIRRGIFRTKLYIKEDRFSILSILSSTEQKQLIQPSCYKHQMPKSITKLNYLRCIEWVNSIHVVPATSHGPSDPLPPRLNRTKRRGACRVNENGRFSKGKGRIVRGQFRKGDLLTAPPRPIKRARPHRGNSSSTRS